MEQVFRHAIARIDKARVSAVRRRQRPGQSDHVFRDPHQMHMIGRQAAAADGYTGIAAAIGKQIAIQRLIGVPEEDGRSAISPLRDMVRNARNYNPSDACHGLLPSLDMARILVNE
ncbi:MAG: hypothetical protein M0P19_09825 [Nevskia sp.]|nr:hypothetical protein [Nevskia sp.]MCK9383205.1 hypothetical protein [Nevskia sp.]